MDTLLRGTTEEIFTENLVTYIRSLLKGKRLAVHIYEDPQMDETEYLLNNPVMRERLLKSVEDVNNGVGLQSFTLDELRMKFNLSNP